MELKIYKQDGSVRKVVSPSDSSVITEEVGGVCSVSLNFEDFEFYTIEVNDYIEVDSVRYKNNAAYRPKMKNRQTYSYALTFFAPIHDAERILMKTEQNGKLESEFSLWGGPREHLQKWVDNMNRAAGSAIWSIGSVITSDNKNIEYRNLSCWDAAFGSNGIAATFGTEMWADGYVVNLCKCERGERVTLGYNNGLTSLLPENNSDKVRFFTRLYPLGSTRNINVSEYGSARLQLPTNAKYVDRNTDRFGIIEATEEAAFAAIYPCYMGTVSAVRSESKTDENGKQFTVYFIKDDKLTWTPEALPGQSFMLSFQSGDLQGYGDNQNKSFQANWHDDTKEWEIINQWIDEQTQVPGGNIVPVVGNQYFPWNMIMPQEYITEAEKRLETAVNDYMASYSVEPVSYKGNTDYIHCDRVHVPLVIGQNVRLESDLYFAEGHLDTRITKVTRKLCRPSDASVTFADKTGTGWKKSVDNQLSSLHYELQKQSEQPGIDIIKSTDSKTPSDNNVFSALRSLATFLRKDRADVMPYLLTLLQGISFKGDKGISGEGAAKLLSAIFGDGAASIDADGASAFKSATVREGVTSDNFSTGALGSGFALKKDENNDSYLEVDRMMVRKIAIFVELLIQRLRHVGGQIVLSPASMTCERVEDRADAYRCYFRSTDGNKTVTNEFVVGDQARCQTFNIKPGVHQGVQNQYYWRLVTAVGDDYIDLSKTDCDRGSTVPQAGDDIVQLGHRNDATRQCAIVLAAHGAGAPYLKMYRNINSYVMDGREIIILSREEVSIIANRLQFSTGMNVETAVNNAQNTANSAQNTANSASGKADQAQDAANNAQTTADSASQKADNAQNTANEASGKADKVGNDLSVFVSETNGKFEANDRKFESNLSESKYYADQAVQAMPISGKNLFRDTKEGGHWYPNNWGGSDFSVEKITEAVTVGGHALNGYVRFLRNGTQGNGDIKTIADYSPKITKADTRNRYVTVSFYARAEQRTAIYLNLCSGGNGEIVAEGETNKEAIISTEWEHKSVTFKTKDEPQYDGLWVWWSWYDAGIPLDMALFQVEFGNRASEWSPSADDVMDYTDQQIGKIPYSGRNLLQMWSIVPGWLSPNDGSPLPSGGTADDFDQMYDYIPVQPNEQLTLSLQGNLDGDIAAAILGRFWIYNSDKASIKQEIPEGIGWRTPQSATFTMPGDAAFVRCSLIRGNVKGLWKLERGAKATDWTPAPEDTAALIEQNASEIKQLPDSITFSVSKKITGGALNYVSGTQEVRKADGLNTANQCVTGYTIHKECIDKHVSTAFKVRFEGCGLGDGSRVTMQVGKVNGWNWHTLVAYEERGFGHGFALSDRGETFQLDGGLTIPYNGEFVIYSYDLDLSDAWGDGNLYFRLDNIDGGKITFSEVRVWKTTADERNATNKEPLPWYPSRWDTGLLDSRITQTANSITLEVENRKSEDEVLSSRIQQTAEQISLKVERQIGGENLLYNSSFASDLVGWGVEGGSANMTAQIVNRDKTVDWLQGFPCLELWFNTASKGIYRYLHPGIEGEGDAFTISFDMLKRNPWPYQLIIGVEDSPQKYVDISNHPINEWRRVTVTQHVSRVGSQAILVYGGEGDGGVVYIKNMKVERGSVATSWCPAPSEQHDKLLATGIDIMNEKIVLTANNTVIQSNSGQQIAMFTEVNGKPLLKAENIDTDNLSVRRLKASSKNLPLGLYADADSATLYITGGATLPGNYYPKWLNAEFGGFNDLSKDKDIGGYFQVRGYRRSADSTWRPQFMRLDNRALTYISKEYNYRSQMTDRSLLLEEGDSRAIFLNPSWTKIKYLGQWYNGYTGTINGLRVIGGIICENSPTTVYIPNINESEFEIDI